MNKLKAYIPALLIAVVAIAIVWRVPRIRAIVTGGN